MIKVKQTILSAPKGNCFAACLASILELPIDVVPNFVGDYGENWFIHLVDWLKPLNLSVVFLTYDNETELPRGYSIMSVESSNGPWNHCLVALDGVAVWDPSPGGNGVIGCKPKLWTVLTVLDPSMMLQVCDKEFHAFPMRLLGEVI